MGAFLCGGGASRTQVLVLFATRKSPPKRAFTFSTSWFGELSALDLTSLHAAGANVGLADMTLFVTNGDLLDVRPKPAIRHAV